MASPKLNRPVHLVLDYDATLTVKDTMAVLGDLPKQPKMSWQEIVEAYMMDYNAYKTAPYPWKAHDRFEYSGWLAARKELEVRSAQRVQEADFFKGVTFEEVENSVKKHLSDKTLQLRDGWFELFQLFSRSKDSEISIVSVNWSETSIRLALLHAAQIVNTTEQIQAEVTSYIKAMKIHANEIQGLRTLGGSSGQICRQDGSDIRTSGDKLRYLPTRADGDSMVIYVGDSSTDFDCLCTADLGVWLSDVSDSQRQQKFKDTFSPFDQSGFEPPALSSLQHLDDDKELFYWSSGFQPLLEILADRSRENMFCENPS